MTLCTTEHMQAWRHECYILGIGPFCASLCTVSQAEVQLLYERFQQLGPDKDGRLNRTVFQKPPYSTDPFSRQVIYLYIALSCSNSYTHILFVGESIATVQRWQVCYSSRFEGYPVLPTGVLGSSVGVLTNPRP